MHRVLPNEGIINTDIFHLIGDFYIPKQFTVLRFQMGENMTFFWKVKKRKTEKKCGKEKPTGLPELQVSFQANKFEERSCSVDAEDMKIDALQTFCTHAPLRKFSYSPIGTWMLI